MQALYEINQDNNELYYYTKRVEHHCDPHFHEKVELLFMLEGEQEIQINENTYHIKAGDIAISDSYDIHAYHLSPAISSVLLFHRCDLQDWIATKGDKTLSSHIIHDRSLVKECLRLADKLTADINPLAYKGYVNLILGLIIDKIPLINSPFAQKNNTLVRRILMYIESHSSEKLALNDLAHEFGYSPTHFSHLWSEYFDTNLTDYCNLIRLRNLFEMRINKPDLSLIDLAFEVGFLSLPTFYRAFSKRFGMPPKKYFAQF